MKKNARPVPVRMGYEAAVMGRALSGGAVGLGNPTKTLGKSWPRR